MEIWCTTKGGRTGFDLKQLLETEAKAFGERRMRRRAW